MIYRLVLVTLCFIYYSCAGLDDTKKIIEEPLTELIEVKDCIFVCNISNKPAYINLTISKNKKKLKEYIAPQECSQKIFELHPETFFCCQLPVSQGKYDLKMWSSKPRKKSSNQNVLQWNSDDWGKYQGVAKLYYIADRKSCLLSVENYQNIYGEEMLSQILTREDRGRIFMSGVYKHQRICTLPAYLVAQLDYLKKIEVSKMHENNAKYVFSH